MKSSAGNHEVFRARNPELYKALTNTPRAQPRAAAPIPVPSPRAAAPPPETEESKIRSVCKIAGRPELADDFLDRKLSYAEVLARITPPAAGFMSELMKKRIAQRGILR